MNALLLQMAAAWRETSVVEAAAALLALAYLVLAIRQNAACWPAALVSSCLYVWVFFGARLYMDAALNGFYALTAAYGFWQWRHGGAGGATLAISRWSLARHAAALCSITALSLFSGFFLRRYTAAAWPFLDSMVSWSSVFATFLVARKVYENWHWWLVIDAVGVLLYLTRHLYITALLFGLYLVLIVVGLRAWSSSLRGGASEPAHAAA